MDSREKGAVFQNLVSRLTRQQRVGLVLLAERRVLSTLSMLKMLSTVGGSVRFETQPLCFYPLPSVSLRPSELLGQDIKNYVKVNILGTNGTR